MFLRRNLDDYAKMKLNAAMLVAVVMIVAALYSFNYFINFEAID